MQKVNIRRILKQPIVRYFIMASFVVGVELAVFAALNSGLNVNYLISTPASMAVALCLNWYLSRVIVFDSSKHALHLEFVLILTTSLVGVGIQLSVTAFCVEILNLLPIIGKFFAIVVTFFWNFWVRKRYIFDFNAF